MNFWIKYERHIDIIAKIFMIIMLLFICYRIVIYDGQINALTRTVANIEADTSGAADGMPVLLGQNTGMDTVAVATNTIVVNIVGAVKEPGVYVLDEGARLIDLIEIAGGAHEYADLERVNQASHLHDASHIRIPFIGESEDDFSLISVIIDGGTSSADTSSSVLVNINTANQTELERLPGIGPAIAGNIITHREANGPFTSVEGLMNVNRIGSSLFENIRHLIVY